MEQKGAVAALAALAQGSRLDVFRLLVRAGAEGMPPGQISQRLGLPAATLSFHLNQLRHAGLVTFRREGRSLIYVAEYDAMNALLAYLTENCCQGDAAACDTSTLVQPKRRARRRPTGCGAAGVTDVALAAASRCRGRLEQAGQEAAAARSIAEPRRA